MTPELRAALRECEEAWLEDDTHMSLYLVDAIAPIVDAAIADAAVAECERGIRQRKVDVRDALLDAAADLEATLRADDVLGPTEVAWESNWLRARANEGNPQ